MKNKIWSIISIAFGIASFVLALIALFYSSIVGRNDMSAAATLNYVFSIISAVLGILGLYCGTKRTEWRVSLVASLGNLSKIALMLDIIIIAATLMS